MKLNNIVLLLIATVCYEAFKFDKEEIAQAVLDLKKNTDKQMLKNMAKQMKPIVNEKMNNLKMDSKKKIKESMNNKGGDILSDLLINSQFGNGLDRQEVKQMLQGIIEGDKDNDAKNFILDKIKDLSVNKLDEFKRVAMLNLLKAKFQAQLDQASKTGFNNPVYDMQHDSEPLDKDTNPSKMPNSSFEDSQYNEL